jgi:hypothetical protein
MKRPRETSRGEIGVQGYGVMIRVGSRDVYKRKLWVKMDPINGG